MFLRQKISAFILWPIALCLSACAPELITPATDFNIAEHYDAEPIPQNSMLDRDWGQMYGSPELSKILSRLNEHNYDLAGALARIAQSQALTDAAFAPLLPGLSGDANGSHSTSPGTEHSTSPPFASTQSNQFSLGLSASYVLDIWGRYRANYEAQKQNLIATSFDKDTLEITLFSLAATDYINLLSARERLAVGQNNIKLANHILNAIKARLDVGTVSALDVAQQEGIVASQKAALPTLIQQIYQTQNQLALLIGQPPEGFHIEERNLEHLKPPHISAGLPSMLLTQRPDIASAEANLYAAQASVAAARRAFLPNITLTATGGLESLALKNLSFPQAEFTSLAAGLTQPIFDGGNLNAQLALSKARQDELLAAYQKAILSAFTDVENALVAVTQTEKQFKLQQDVLGSAQRAYLISEERLREGTIDIVTLLSVQQTMFQAQDALVQSKQARLLASLSLIQALGGGMRVHATQDNLRDHDADDIDPLH